MFMALWEFCASLIADRFVIPRKRPIWKQLALILVSMVLAVGLAAIIWLALAALIIVPKAMISD
jgi:hypothetical protein